MNAIINPTVRLAPNGEVSLLSPEQWDYVRTAEFKAWFGDWEKTPAKASKVLDVNGEPLVVYHGTGAKRFTTFADLSFFSDSLKIAQTYSNQKQPDGTCEPNVYSAFLNIRKPKELAVFTLQMDRIATFNRLKTTDGTINPLGNTGAFEYVIRKGDQAKIFSNLNN